MKDAEARQMIADLRSEQEAFKAQMVAAVEQGLRPVAVQAAAAGTAAAKAETAVASVQEQLEVLATEGNEVRVELNAVRESVVQMQETLGTLIKNFQTAMAGFTVVEKPVEGMPTAMNRAARRAMTRAGMPVQHS